MEPSKVRGLDRESPEVQCKVRENLHVEHVEKGRKILDYVQQGLDGGIGNSINFLDINDDDPLRNQPLSRNGCGEHVANRSDLRRFEEETSVVSTHG